MINTIQVFRQSDKSDEKREKKKKHAKIIIQNSISVLCVSKYPYIYIDGEKCDSINV